MSNFIPEIWGKQVTEQLQRHLDFWLEPSFEETVTQKLLACSLGQAEDPNLIFISAEPPEREEEQWITFQIR